MLGLGQAAVIIAPVISFCYSGSDYENLFEPMSTDEGAKPGMTLKGLPFQKTYFTHVLFSVDEKGKKKVGCGSQCFAGNGLPHQMDPRGIYGRILQCERATGRRTSSLFF